MSLLRSPKLRAVYSPRFYPHRCGTCRRFTASLTQNRSAHIFFCIFQSRGEEKQQWQVEVRAWFEESLALIQLLPLNIAETAQAEYNKATILSQYQRIRSMVKFNSVGLRNVSTWGFLGLLAMAGAVLLGSIKTEDEELWLALGVRRLYRFSLWSLAILRQLLWKLAPASAVRFFQAACSKSLELWRYERVYQYLVLPRGQGSSLANLWKIILRRQ